MGKASDRIEAQSDASAELLLTSHGQRMVMHGADVAHDTLDRVAAEEQAGGSDRRKRLFLWLNCSVWGLPGALNGLLGHEIAHSVR